MDDALLSKVVIDATFVILFDFACFLLISARFVEVKLVLNHFSFFVLSHGLLFHFHDVRISCLTSNYFCLMRLGFRDLQCPYLSIVSTHLTSVFYYADD